MDYSQPPRDTPHRSDGQQVAEGSGAPNFYPAEFYPRLVGERNVQWRTSNQPTANYPPVYPPPGTRSNLDTHFLESGENRYGSTLLCPPPSATHRHSHHPAAEAHGQHNVLGSWPEPHSGVTQMPHRRAGPGEGTLRAVSSQERAGEDTYNYNCAPGRRRCTPYDHPALGSPEPGYTSHGNRNGSAIPRVIPFRSNVRASISGGGRHESQSSVMTERSMQASQRSHPNDPGPHPYPVLYRSTFARGKPCGGEWSGHHGPHPEAHPFRWQPPLVSTPISVRLSGRGTDTPEYADSLDLRGFSNRGTGYVAHIAELPGRHTGIQRLKEGGQVKRTTDTGKAALVQRPTRGRNSSDSKNSIAQLWTTSIATRGSTRLILVPQTPYRCPTRQDNWEEEAPIEFWDIKLTDAADRAYLDLDGHDDKVLDYQGVGSSISCRANFSGHKFEKSKIRTTNNKTPPEAITKRKLAFEISKFAKRHIESIKARPGYGNITFESLVLVRLVRVSKSSWQPVFGYDVSSPGLGPS